MQTLYENPHFDSEGLAHKLTQRLIPQLDQTDKSSLIERKIRVNWLAAEDSVSLNGGSASAVASTPNRQSVVNGVCSLTARRL